MSDLGPLFQSFYTHFVLRDLFGKAGPGAVLLGTIVVSFSSFSSALDLAGKASLGAWIAFVAVAWLIGLSLQGLGELLHFFRYYPKNITQATWEDKVVRFRKVASPAQTQDFERFAVIKEACGNAALAAAAGLVMIPVFKWGTTGSYTAIALIALSIPGLARMHFANATRGYDYVVKVLEKNDCSPGTSKAAEQRAGAGGGEGQ